MLGVADHVHVEDAGFVETLDDVHWGDADGGDEELGAGVDDDGDEVVEFAFCVVVTVIGVRSVLEGGLENVVCRPGLMTKGGNEVRLTWFSEHYRQLAESEDLHRKVHSCLSSSPSAPLSARGACLVCSPPLQ